VIFQIGGKGRIAGEFREKLIDIGLSVSAKSSAPAHHRIAPDPTAPAGRSQWPERAPACSAEVYPSLATSDVPARLRRKPLIDPSRERPSLGHSTQEPGGPLSLSRISQRVANPFGRSSIARLLYVQSLVRRSPDASSIGCKELIGFLLNFSYATPALNRQSARDKSEGPALEMFEGRWLRVRGRLGLVLLGPVNTYRTAATGADFPEIEE